MPAAPSCSLPRPLLLMHRPCLSRSALSCPAADPAPPAGKVSYYKDVRPIFQQHCQGCHQPAKPLAVTS